MISEPCTCCHATGRVEALETSFSKIEHEICRLLVSDFFIWDNKVQATTFFTNFITCIINGHSFCLIFLSLILFDQSMTDQKADPENPKSWPRFILRVDRHMCNYLTSGKRTRLAVLSSSLKVWILLKVCRISLNFFWITHWHIIVNCLGISPQVSFSACLILLISCRFQDNKWMVVSGSCKICW